MDYAPFRNYALLSRCDGQVDRKKVVKCFPSHSTSEACRIQRMVKTALPNVDAPQRRLTSCLPVPYRRISITPSTLRARKSCGQRFVEGRGPGGIDGGKAIRTLLNELLVVPTSLLYTRKSETSYYWIVSKGANSTKMKRLTRCLDVEVCRRFGINEKWGSTWRSKRNT
jgi:hypothetical protein